MAAFAESAGDVTTPEEPAPASPESAAPAETPAAEASAPESAPEAAPASETASESDEAKINPS